ncbi:MAG: RNA polymerase sigma factor [Verrucomicrobiales bacterium]
MPDDPVAALHEFAQSGDEAAFRLVVDGFGGLVFANALRRTGDPGMAEEISQNVFAVLARKAQRVANHPSPEGWLFTTTRLEAAMAMRKRHQHQRKLQALAGEAGTIEAPDNSDAEAWREALPYLCDSPDSLGQSDREILLARFYSGNSFRELAQRSGKSEAAGKMRVKRSLDRLHRWMSQRGIQLSAGALASGLSSEWAMATPAALKSTLPGTAIATAPELTTGKLISNSLGTMGRTAKVGLLTAGAAMVAGVCLVQSSPPEREKNSVVSPSATGEQRIVKLRSAAVVKPRAGNLPAPAAGDRDANDVGPPGDELANFWLPSITLDGVSAKQALDHLQRQFQSLGGDRSVVFDYALPDDEETFPVTVSLGNVPLTQALLRVATEAGVALELRENRVAMVALPDGGTEISAETFRVPPDFLSSRELSDPKQLFPGLPPDTELEYLPATSELAVTGDARTLARVAAMANCPHGVTQIQVRLGIRFIHCPDQKIGDSRILPVEETEALLGGVVEGDQLKMTWNPQTVTRLGQESTTSLQRTVPIDAGEEQTVGKEVTILPQLVAHSLNLTGGIYLSDLGELRASSFGSGMSGAFQDELIGLDLTLDDGQSALVECLTDGAGGGRLMAMITATLIDPSGQPLDR